MRTIVRSALLAFVCATAANAQAIPAGAVYLGWQNLHIAFSPDSSGAAVWVAFLQPGNHDEGFSASFVPSQVAEWAPVALELLGRPLSDSDSAIARASPGLPGHAGETMYVLRRRDKGSWLQDRFLVLETLGDTTPTVIRGTEEQIKSIVRNLVLVAARAPFNPDVATRMMVEDADARILDSRPTAKTNNRAPAYPPEARASNTQGMVVLSFFIEADGRPDIATARPFYASHQVFLDSVLRALANMQFNPGVKDGKPVRTRVKMPFFFSMLR